VSAGTARGRGQALLARSAVWLRRQFVDPEYPLTAIEVRPHAVGVVRFTRSGSGLSLAAAASVDLPPGTLKLSVAEANVADAAAFRQALHGALERAGVLGAGAVGLVLPDPVARVALVPGSEVQARRRKDLEEMIRFRLRKAVPFDIREARVCWSPVGSGAARHWLVAAIARPVLEGYEGVCASLGLHPGLVELAGLTLLGAAFPPGTSGDHLLVNWDDGYVSLILSREGAPVLVRTLAGEFASAPEQVAREAQSTVLYYRERLGGAGLAGAVVRSTSQAPADAVAWLREPLGLEPEMLDAWGPAGADAGHGAAQALAGAAACLRRRAA
jgi:hypothetical protein